MFFRINDKIVALTNVKSVELHVSGSGAKSNPYLYMVKIEYFGEEYTSLYFEEEGIMAKNTMNEIFKALNGKE